MRTVVSTDLVLRDNAATTRQLTLYVAVTPLATSACAIIRRGSARSAALTHATGEFPGAKIS